jgi:hypothetical protein
MDFLRKDPRKRNCWGYTFNLTDEHLSIEELDRLKLSYDTLADEALAKLEGLTPNRSQPKNPDADSLAQDQGTQSNPFVKRDLYALLRDNTSKDESLDKLWKQANTVPDWVDWDQLAAGQEVFYRYGGPALTGLGFQSLLGGMGAFRVVEVSLTDP